MGLEGEVRAAFHDDKRAVGESGVRRAAVVGLHVGVDITLDQQDRAADAVEFQ
jgi:hypothetical protein